MIKMNPVICQNSVWPCVQGLAAVSAVRMYIITRPVNRVSKTVHIWNT